MKKNLFKPTALIMLSSMAITITSCTKLTEEPYSAISTGQFYKTEADANAALTAAYGPLADLYNTAGTCASDWSADQSYPRQAVGRNTLTLFNYDANYTTQKSFSRTFESPQQIWISCYSGIEKANWVITKVPDIFMADATKDAILGEAYFLRAFYHFTLTKNFGDVIVKTVVSDNIDAALKGVSPKADVYKQIFTDLDVAVTKLPVHSPSLVKGRISKEIALALYAKAALYASSWSLALEKAKLVIASNKFTLLTDPVDLYNVAKEDAARTENMWAYECESTNPGRSSQLMSLFGPKNSDSPPYGTTTFGSVFAYQGFYDSFNPTDKRRLLLATSYITKSGTVVAQKDITPITTKGVLIKKYMDPNSIGANQAVNVPILRYADIYLIAAEAEARANGVTVDAYLYLNKVHQRSNVDPVITGLTPDQFIAAVLQERSWEFFGEGDRWYDLTRTNTFMQVIPTAVNDVYPTRTVQPKHRYFPIPQDEINANNKIVQNSDWK
jgi:hypothetical protein